MIRFAGAMSLTGAAFFVGVVPATAEQKEMAALDPGARNPILPGYLADPSTVHYKGEWFIFATEDPWGGDWLGPLALAQFPRLDVFGAELPDQAGSHQSDFR